MSKKKKVKIRTQNEKIVEADLAVYGTKNIKKHLLESGRNSECKRQDELSLIFF